MKKLFTLMAVAMTAASAWAAAPEILFGDKPVEPGKIYETGYTVEETDFMGMTIYSYTQDSDLFLKGILDEFVVVEVEATSNVQVCSIDGQCTMGQSVVKEGFITGTADADNMVVSSLRIDLITSDMSGVSPSQLLNDITVNVKAYYEDTPEEAVETTVVLTNRPASEFNGIASVDGDNNSVKLGYGNTLEYNVTTPTKLDIYNVNGGLVVSQKIYRAGSISLDSLHPGVYIYSAGKQKGKVLIRK